MREKKPKEKRASTPAEVRAAAERQLSEVLKRLRAKIREQGFTQSRVEEAVGWKRNHVSSLVGGKTALRVDHLFAICAVIDVPPRELLGTGLRIDTAAERALGKLLRTYAHPRKVLGDFKESELLAAAEERVARAKGMKAEYLRDVILWCRSSMQLAKRSAQRRAGKVQLTAKRDPGMIFPTFTKYQKPGKQESRK